MSDDETTNHQTISMHPNFPQISRHGARLRKNSKRSKTSCGGSFKPVNQFTSLAYQEYHGDIRRDRKTLRWNWDVFASRWKGNGNSSILREPSSTVGDISRKIAVLPYTGWDWKIYQKRIEDGVSSTKKDQGRTKNQDPPSPNDLNPCESASETSETLKQQRQPCNATKSLCKFFSPFHVAIICRTNLWGAKMQRCKHLRWGWFLGLDASGDIHLALLVVLLTLWHWEDDTHWYLRLLTSVPLQNWSESTPTVMYLHVLHLLCRADVSPNDVAASEDTLVGRCILPASWDAHREVV